MGINQYFEKGNFETHSNRMDDKDYAGVLDNIVIAAIDCIIINDKSDILLGKRTREPLPSWWIIGGRMKPGESFENAASRKLK